MRHVLVLFAVIAAGCVSTPEPAESNDPSIPIYDGSQAPRPELEDPAKWSNGTLNEIEYDSIEDFTHEATVELTQIRAPGSTLNNDSACIQLRTNRLIAATVTATWTANNDLHETLQLHATGSAPVSGPSPLTLRASDVTDSIQIWVSGPNPGSIVQQEVDLHISGKYQGGARAWEAGC
jgi:hypothetical protein